MDIIFQAHHAVISDLLRSRAERYVRKLAVMLGRPVNALVRFESDGRQRRVEIHLHAPRRHALVAEARHQTYGPALAAAAEHLAAQIRKGRRPRRARHVVPSRA